MTVMTSFSANGKLHSTDLRFSVQSPDRMRIRTGPDFEIQCILYGKWPYPDCVVRIAVKGLYCVATCTVMLIWWTYPYV